MKRESHLLSGRGNALVATLALVFLYLPIVTLVALSFNENDLTTIWSGFSLNRSRFCVRRVLWARFVGIPLALQGSLNRLRAWLSFRCTGSRRRYWRRRS